MITEALDRIPLWTWVLVIALGITLGTVSVTPSPPRAEAAMPSDADQIVRALDRISAKLEKLDDTLRDRCGR